MKRLFVLLCLVWVTFSCVPEIKDECGFSFHSDGTFKIVQVADLHFNSRQIKEGTCFLLSHISKVIETESPDLIVFTGDNVTSLNTMELWGVILDTLEKDGVPFVCTYGNHDLEKDFSETSLPSCFAESPLCINTLSGQGSIRDMAIPVKSSSSSKTAAVLYIIDSGDYSNVPEESGYGWITHDQVHWYVEASRAFAGKNGNVPVPSYAFFHIPVFEFREAFESGLVCGSRGEEECPANLNSGLFSAFEENDDVHAMFAGHDHSNDYVARHGDIAAVYGRCSHYGVNMNPPCGTRVIELREGDYGFTTWVRETEGVADSVSFEVGRDYGLKKASEGGKFETGLRRSVLSGGRVVSCETVPTPRIIRPVGEGSYDVVQEGFLYVPESGTVYLHVSAYDEGSVVLDDVSFSGRENGRGHIRTNMEKGYHPIRICQKSGDRCWCKLMWRTQYENRYHEIPSEFFFHKP